MVPTVRPLAIAPMRCRTPSAAQMLPYGGRRMRMHRSVAMARSSRLASKVQDDVRLPQRGEESPEGANLCAWDEHLPRDPTGHQARPSDIHAQAAGHQAADHPFDVGKALGPLAGRKGMDAIAGCVEMGPMAALPPSLR